MLFEVKGYKNYDDLIFPDDPRAISGPVITYYLTPEELAEFNRKYPVEISKDDAGSRIVALMDRQKLEMVRLAKEVALC